MASCKEFRITKTDHVIFALLACWCMVDSVNGLLLRSDFMSISQIFKISVAFIVIKKCQGNKTFNNLLFGIIVYLSLYLFNIVLHGEEVASSITLVSKLITSILFYYYFLQVLSADESYFEQKAYHVFKWNFLFFAANMLLGIMGFGYAAYGDAEDGIGSKGFFYAGNELSGVVAAVFPWVFFYIIKNYSNIIYFMSGIVLFVLVYTLSTKSGIFATFLLFLMTALFYGDKKIKIIISFSSIVLAFYIIIHIHSLLETEVAVIERFYYFLERDGLMDAMTSGRLDHWGEESVVFFKSDILIWVFGLGGMRTVEMDPPDSLLNCGLIGFIALMSFYIKGLAKPFKRRYKNNPYRLVVFYSNVILVVISIVAGHILFSSMAGMLIALSNAMLLINKNNTYITPPNR